MSSDGADRTGAPPLPDEFARLEAAVRRLLEEVAGYRARARVAEARAGELERTLRDLETGRLDPDQLRVGLRDLQEENGDLRRRLDEARDRVRRLIARFDFLREEM